MVKEKFELFYHHIILSFRQLICKVQKQRKTEERWQTNRRFLNLNKEIYYLEKKLVRVQLFLKIKVYYCKTI